MLFIGKGIDFCEIFLIFVIGEEINYNNVILGFVIGKYEINNILRWILNNVID